MRHPLFDRPHDGSRGWLDGPVQLVIEATDLPGSSVPAGANFPGYDNTHVAGRITARLGLTDTRGNPLCAAVRPPLVERSA